MKLRINVFGFRAVLLLAAVLLSPVVGAQTPQSMPQAGYTQPQANDGKQKYEQVCATCHGFELQGFELAPSLKGRNFEQRWGGKSADVLAMGLRRMPPNAPG